MKGFSQFFRYFRPYRITVLTGIAFIFASMLFGLAGPWLIGRAVDDLLAGATWNKIIYYSSGVLILNLISGVFLFWQRRLIINTSRHVEYDMRREYYEHLVNQPQTFFHANRVGDLMARATNDMAAVRQIMGPMILYSFQAIFALIVAVPILLNISWKLTVLLLITMPFVSLTVKFLGQQIHIRFEKIQEFFSHITSKAQENLSGVRVIRAYAQEEAEIAEFRELNHQYARQNLNLVKYSAAMRPLLLFLIGIGFVIIFIVGIPMAVRGEISAGDFAAFNLYLQRMIWYLIALGYVVNLYQRGAASMKRIKEIQNIVPLIKDEGFAVEQPAIKGRIEFRNLNFSYKPELPAALKNINLVVEPGQTVAFVGKTGSGKSTLISLTPRLLDASNDEVLIDGVPIKKFPLRQLRRAIGFIQQESFLFSNTLAENIALGVEKTRREKDLASDNGNLSQMTVEKAADIAGITEDISNFPHKFEQIVGERGITLSGGQKQRASIARAVMRDPRILILDDALSAVDTYTEEQILRNLRQVRQNRTTLIVSHRVSTVKDADLICVLREGEIIERGKHEELVALDGEYADLYRRQLLEEELAATT